MERMLVALDEHNLDDENHSLEKFYESVRMRVQGVDTAEGRQKLIVQLYDTFSPPPSRRPSTSSASSTRRSKSSTSSSARPTTCCESISARASPTRASTSSTASSGTGTFITRLLQLGLIEPKDLARKYAHELHANEILLLAYYIAAVNIETTYQTCAASWRSRRLRAPSPD